MKNNKSSIYQPSCLPRSVHTTPQLRCNTDILMSFCRCSHRSITAFRVKINLTFMRHLNDSQLAKMKKSIPDMSLP